MTPSPTPPRIINPLPATVVSRLDQYGVLSVSSVDNLKFLQGQFTCDLNEINTGQWRYGALCTNKGRMISNFLLTQIAPNHHLLRLHLSTLEAVHSTLKKFAPFYKGMLNDASADYVVVGIAGENSKALVENTFSIQLPQTNGAKTTEQFTLVNLNDQRYECWIKKEFLESYWPKLISNATVVEEGYWDLLNIRAGLGEVRQPTIEEWTPHMLNLQAIGAISFKKGCYTGQEIVARTEYRGQQKRAMYRIAGSGTPPIAGTVLTNKDINGEHNSGEIIMSQTTANQQWEALAVLSDKDLEGITLFCAGTPVQILDLPYPIRKTISATP